ncbi:MAG TPA: Yip1 family protein [Aliidongia sp.]|uniref:Yip1 family protein n=1 Tax=Aliidongia sp. TaxID=1914230 RepID=UPI002DDD5BBB|nr:Yip1 family protein [Aliidongia sp.]HEV2677668.1 Yip1 family protein [Aliidongia sp.]
MTVLDQRPAAFAGIVARAKGILLEPRTEWLKIDAEPATIGGIYTGYVVQLAAIGPVCTAIRGLVFGYGIAGFTYRPSIGTVLSQAVLHYVLSLIGVFVMALIIDALAPTFGGQRNRVQALKVSAYSWTAAWIVGVFGLLPYLGFLGILGLYSFYLLYLGLPRLMKAPEAKAIGYTVVVVISAIVLYAVVGIIGARLMGFGDLMPTRSAAVESGTGALTGSGSGTINLPNGSHVDVAKLQGVVNQLGAMAKQMDGSQPAGTPATGASGQAIPAVSTDALKALLPASLPGGFARTETQTGKAFGGTNAEATYRSGNRTMTLSVTDMAAAGSLATLAGAFGVESDHETATGFEKVGRVDGQLTIQQYDRTSQNGKYSVMVGDRFLVDAEGTVDSFDSLKSAVASVGPDRLLTLK